MACTTLLAGKDATVDGSTMIARNEDFGHALNPKRFIVVNPEDQPTDYQSVTKKLKVDLPGNPQRYTAIPENPEMEKKMGKWGEAGINASNVAMSATETSTTNSRVLGVDPLVDKGIGEEDFVTIVLPYIHSAKEGVQLLGKYLEKYGTYESNGVIFSDKDNIWYMETIGGHHWAAKRVPDDCYVVAPNWFSITDFDFNADDTMSSDDLEAMINDYHLNVDGGSTYNLRHIFGSHMDSDYEYNVPREWYIQKILSPSQPVEHDDIDLPFAKHADHKLTLEDFKYALSSHYQRTPYDIYNPDSTDAKRTAFRPVGIQRNQELHVLQIRNDVPASIAGICWVAFGPNPYNAIAPFYANVTDTPAPYRDTTNKFDIKNMYWMGQLLATIGDDHHRRYNMNLEAMSRTTVAGGRHIMMETDAAAQKLSGSELQSKLEEANEKIAKNAYDAAMKCLGDMTKTGTLAIKLNH